MRDKALGLIGIAKKAGLLALGSEAASIASRQGKAWLIITAKDASPGTVRRAQANAKAEEIEHIATPYTKFDFGSITGRGSPGVIAFLDKGLAESFKKKLTLQPEANRQQSSDQQQSTDRQQGANRQADAGTVKEDTAI